MKDQIKNQENNAVAKGQKQSAAAVKLPPKKGIDYTFRFEDNRPESVAQRKFQEITNNDPQAARLRSFRTLLTNSPRNGEHVAQRKVVIENDEIKPVVEEIKTQDTFITCAQSPQTVSIKLGATSAAAPRTPHSDHLIKKGVDVEITMKQEDLTNGLKADLPTTINADGKNEEVIPVREDTGMVPIFDITGKYNPIKRPLRNEIHPKVPRGISGATVLLHEMGHAVQYLKTLPEMALRQKIYKGHQVFDLPELSDLNSLKKDISEGNVSSERWTLRSYELEDMDMILGIHRDSDTDVDELETLRLKVLDRVKIWMEHDVMIHVEHPFAAERNEGIRLRHGEELDQVTPNVVKENSKMRLKHNARDVRTVAGKDNLTKTTAPKEMITRLQLDSQDLPKMIYELVNKYKLLKKGDILEEHVDNKFKGL